MFDLTQLLISSAYAQDAAPAAPPSAGMMGYVPLILILAVFYFLVIRPQQKRQSELEKMLKALQRGDRVVTSGGIHGKIAKFDGDEIVVLEIAEGVEMRIDRGNIGGLEAKPTPAVEAKSESK